MRPLSAGEIFGAVRMRELGFHQDHETTLFA